MMSPPRKRRSQSSSQVTMAVSRWLVGSSRISTSAGWIRAAANARRLRCPPERVPTFRSKSVSPSLVSIDFASYSLSSRNSGGKLKKTCSKMVASSRITGFWERKLTCTLGSRVTLPSSGSICPESTRRKVDFPVPLMPMTPTRSPGSK